MITIGLYQVGKLRQFQLMHSYRSHFVINRTRTSIYNTEQSLSVQDHRQFLSQPGSAADWQMSLNVLRLCLCVSSAATFLVICISFLFLDSNIYKYNYKLNQRLISQIFIRLTDLLKPLLKEVFIPISTVTMEAEKTLFNIAVYKFFSIRRCTYIDFYLYELLIIACTYEGISTYLYANIYALMRLLTVRPQVSYFYVEVIFF